MCVCHISSEAAAAAAFIARRDRQTMVSLPEFSVSRDQLWLLFLKKSAKKGRVLPLLFVAFYLWHKSLFPPCVSAAPAINE